MLGMALIILSAVFAYFLIGNYFPSFILTVIFITLGTLIIRNKKEVKRIDRTIYLLAIITALSITLRANGILTFLNFFATIYLGCYLILDDKIRNRLNIIQLIFLPLFFIVRLIQIENKLSYKKITKIKLKENTVAVIITIIALLLILPLLSSANPIFKNWVKPFADLINFKDFFDKYFQLDFLPPRLVLFGFMAFFFPKILSYLQINPKDDLQQRVYQLALLIPKIVISLVLAAFFVSQFQLYFASTETLKTLGLTHSQYAREVFAQLSIVSAIILVLVYFDRNKTKLDKKMTMILLIEGIFLTLMAAKSDFDYTSMFGFTHKRLYGFATAVWIAGIYLFYGYYQLKQIVNERLLKPIVFYTAAILIIVNLLNFDYLIYHVNPPRVNGEVDYNYLLFNISDDGINYQQMLDKAFNFKKEKKTYDWNIKFQAISKLTWNVRELRQKYKQLPISWFNLSEYQQYLKTKDINIEKYETVLPGPVIQQMPLGDIEIKETR